MRNFLQRHVGTRALLFFLAGAAFATSIILAFVLEPARPYSNVSTLWFAQTIPAVDIIIGIYMLVRAIFAPIGTVVGRRSTPEIRPVILADGTASGERTPDYQLHVSTATGTLLWISVSAKAYDRYTDGSVYPRPRKWLS